MASKKDNIKALFTNSRTRIIILFTLVLLVLMLVIGFVKFEMASRGALNSSNANLANAPGNISSIPGSIKQTEEYAALQNTQNVQQASSALKTGGSAIPTIIHAQAFGNGLTSIGPQGGKGSIGFSSLALEENGGAQKSLWLQDLKNNHCNSATIQKVMQEGASLEDVHSVCSCDQLFIAKLSLEKLKPLCGCDNFKDRDITAKDFKLAGYSATQLFQCGFSACSMRAAGFTPAQMKDAGYSDGELKGAGISDSDINQAGGIPAGITAADIRAAGCGVAALEKLRVAGVSAGAIRRISGCSASQLKAAGYTDAELKAAGFTAAQIAGTGSCDLAKLKAARAQGVSAATLVKTLGCSAKALLAAGYTPAELRAAGFTAAELKAAGVSAAALKAAGFSAKDLLDAGFTPKELKAAGFTANQLRDAGVSAAALKAAGFTAAQLKAAGFSATELKAAGFSAKDLLAAGFSPKDLKGAGFTADELRAAGVSDQGLQDAGFSAGTSALAALDAVAPSNLTGLPSIPGTDNKAASNAEQNAQILQQAYTRQRTQQADQRFQQKLQQKTAAMLSEASQDLQTWKKVSTQAYAKGTENKAQGTDSAAIDAGMMPPGNTVLPTSSANSNAPSVIKTGDILFAVIDTSVNSDEPGPILATIVSDKLRGSKLIGSFNLPANAEKMTITFNTLSVPGVNQTMSINAYAIDPETARTALSSQTNHHYLERYGALFASTFLQGFGNAFQSADTTITIGGTGGTTDTTVQNGIGRSALENAVIGLATVGQSWGQYAQKAMSTPTTVLVYSGTGVGVLFTQDVKTI